MHPDPMLDEETAWNRRMREHEATLKVGARVRVRLNEACPEPYCADWESDDDDTKIADGDVGVIGWIPDLEQIHGPRPSKDQHDYGIRLARGIAWFAAGELLVLRAADPGEEGPR